MSENERDTIMPLIIRGFQDNAKSVGVDVLIKNSVYNPWCIIGGVATSICIESEFIK